MSCDKWAYSPNKCDGQPCPGDCDLCDLADVLDDEDEEEIEQEIKASQKGFE